MTQFSFCNRLSIKEGLEPCYELNGNTVKWPESTQCQGYRLPTEAEWDYAARGGLPIQVNGTFRLYAGSSRYGLMGWSEENAMGRPHEVGEKYPNNWGLVDVSGNVAEWVWDWYGPYGTRSVDPVGPEQGHARVLRGGSWQDSVVDVQTTRRNSAPPQHRHETIGFRVARTLGVSNQLPKTSREEN